MRILFDAGQPEFKTPFGTLKPEEICTLHIHIPTSVPALSVTCIFTREDGSDAFSVALTPSALRGDYQIFRGEFSILQTGLYFYYFRIQKPEGSFRLFKDGNQTNMEAGDLWQISCIPGDFTTPDWAKGAVIYQIFPDRFHKSGSCDLTGKLTPYTLHENWEEEVGWMPNDRGEILNNDFFGGNFQGIAEKLDYIAALGVTILYLNPICKSFSNHRYDTADYMTPDPMLGTTADFQALCRSAHQRGIRIVLDGVFSHTGANSLYFDQEGVFGGNGAYCSENSPYYSWYQFHHHPDSYAAWWGFDTLPTVNKMDPGFLSYIITGENSVIAHWLKLGADGFRLDVADELPNEFIHLLKVRMRQIRPDSLLVGEVWEDASNKIAYGIRRRYFVDGTLDSVMNYPLRAGILNFVKGCDDGSQLRQTVETLRENYPPEVFLCNMNLLGSHDTARISTALVDDFEGSREVLAGRFLSEQQKIQSKQRLVLASVLQYTLPGAPCLYYGDETGMEGGTDPFNRRPYPWGRADAALIAHYQWLGDLRKKEVLRLGDISFFYAAEQKIGFSRTWKNRTAKIYVNRSADIWHIRDDLSVAPMDYCITEE